MINLYRDRPDLYDLLHDDQTADLAFYAGIARATVPENGSALELGCGSGRVMEALLEGGQGLRVTGLDDEDAMLARSRARLTPFGEQVRLVRGDMRRLDLGDLKSERFDFVLIAANTFLHLEDHAAQRACLAGIRALLRPEGLAILDVTNPFYAMALPQGTLTLRRQVVDEETGRETAVTGVLEVDPTWPRVVDRLFFDEWGPNEPLHRLASRVELRLIFMPELELLLASAGLGIADAYGDYELGPYHAGAERMIVVLRPREQLDSLLPGLR